MSKASKTGLWLNSVTGKIVRSEPERGRVLVHPGAEIPEHLRAVIDGGAERAVAPKNRETRGPDDGPGEPVKPAPKKSKKKG